MASWERYGWAAYANKASRGLANPGNWCYRNTVYVTLSHMPAFLRWLEDHDSQACGLHSIANFCAACELKAFSSRFWLEEAEGAGYKKSKTQAMNQAINRIANKDFDSFPTLQLTDENGQPKLNCQDDAADFIAFLVNHLKASETLDAVPKGLSDLFFLDFVEDWTCASGHNHATKPSEEPAILQLSISGDADGESRTQEPIGWYMEQHIFSQKLERSIEKSGCSSCADVREKRAIARRIAKAPTYLVLRLVLYVMRRNNRNAWVLLKVKEKPQIPLALDLSAYTSGEAAQEPLYYKLHNTIVHRGPNGNSGHYINYSIAPDGQVYDINNHHVKISGKQDLQTPDDGEPFLLSYARCTEEEFKAVAAEAAKDSADDVPIIEEVPVTAETPAAVKESTAGNSVPESKEAEDKPEESTEAPAPKAKKQPRRRKNTGGRKRKGKKAAKVKTIVEAEKAAAETDKADIGAESTQPEPTIPKPATPAESQAKSPTPAAQPQTSQTAEPKPQVPSPAPTQRVTRAMKRKAEEPAAPAEEESAPKKARVTRAKAVPKTASGAAKEAEEAAKKAAAEAKKAAVDAEKAAKRAEGEARKAAKKAEADTRRAAAATARKAEVERRRAEKKAEADTKKAAAAAVKKAEAEKRKAERKAEADTKKAAAAVKKAEAEKKKAEGAAEKAKAKADAEKAKAKTGVKRKRGDNSEDGQGEGRKKTRTRGAKK